MFGVASLFTAACLFAANLASRSPSSSSSRSLALKTLDCRYNEPPAAGSFTLKRCSYF